MARPWKYDRLIKILEDNELYHTSKVIRNAEKLGLFEYSFDDPEKKNTKFDKRASMKKARSAIANFSAKYMPKEPDDLTEVTKPFLAYYPSFYGWRWKQTLTEQNTPKSKARSRDKGQEPVEQKEQESLPDKDESEK